MITLTQPIPKALTFYNNDNKHWDTAIENLIIENDVCV